MSAVGLSAGALAVCDRVERGYRRRYLTIRDLFGSVVGPLAEDAHAENRRRSRVIREMIVAGLLREQPGATQTAIYEACGPLAKRIAKPGEMYPPTEESNGERTDGNGPPTASGNGGGES